MPDYYVTWSEREALTEVRTRIQESDMDEALRTDLWNAFRKTVTYWDGQDALMENLWMKVLRQPLDDASRFLWDSAVMDAILHGEWRQACDVIVFAAEALPPGMGASFIESANAAFDRGKFVWRFSGRKLVRRMGEVEIKAVEVALQDSRPFPEVRKQLETALEEFSSRGNPNYGHAAKEAVSAVETLCRKILDKPSITLGDALDEIRKSRKLQIHGALISSFSNLYGYASDKGYVRHGGKPDDLTDVTLEEAQLVLVSCSAIVSFLIARADREGTLE